MPYARVPADWHSFGGPVWRCRVCESIAASTLDGDPLCASCFRWAAELLGVVAHARGNIPPCCWEAYAHRCAESG